VTEVATGVEVGLSRSAGGFYARGGEPDRMWKRVEVVCGSNLAKRHGLRAGYTSRSTAHGGKRTPARVFGFSIGSKSASAGLCWIRTTRSWFTPTGRPRSYTRMACGGDRLQGRCLVLELTDADKAALAALLKRIIAADPFPMSLWAILEQSPARPQPFPAPRRIGELSYVLHKRRGRR
jgi:hypothetical protein